MLMQLATCHAWSRQEAIAIAAEGLLEHSTSTAGSPLCIGDAVRPMASACCPPRARLRPSATTIISLHCCSKTCIIKAVLSSLLQSRSKEG